MNERKNAFSHPSLAPNPGYQKTTMPADRMAQMNEMLNEEPEADSDQPELQTMASGDLEQLIFLGCIEDSKVIAGYSFDLKTLTAKEQNDVWLSVAFLNNDTKFFVVKVAFLARAIKAVNGRPLDVMYKGKDFRELTKEQRSHRVIEGWQDALINELYQFYTELVERSKKVIHPDQIKK